MESNEKPKAPAPKPDIRPEIKTVVKSKPIKKENALLTYARNFINDDLATIGRYMMDEVIVPTFVNGIAQSLHTGISMFFRTGSTGYYGNYYRGDKYGEWWNKEIKNDYGKYYRGDDRPYRPIDAPPWEDPRSSYSGRSQRYSDAPLNDYLDYPLSSYAEAQEVLRTIRDHISWYERLSIADFYKVVGYKYPPDAWEINRNTLLNLGWLDLSTVQIANKTYRGRIVYYLTMPKAVDIR